MAVNTDKLKICWVIKLGTKIRADALVQVQGHSDSDFPLVPSSQVCSLQALTGNEDHSQHRGKTTLVNWFKS